MPSFPALWLFGSVQYSSQYLSVLLRSKGLLNFFGFPFFSNPALLSETPPAQRSSNMPTEWQYRIYSPVGNSRSQPVAIGSKLEDLPALLWNSHFFIRKHRRGKVWMKVTFPGTCEPASGKELWAQTLYLLLAIGLGRGNYAWDKSNLCSHLDELSPADKKQVTPERQSRD